MIHLVQHHLQDRLLAVSRTHFSILVLDIFESTNARVHTVCSNEGRLGAGTLRGGGTGSSSLPVLVRVIGPANENTSTYSRCANFSINFRTGAEKCKKSSGQMLKKRSGRGRRRRATSWSYNSTTRSVELRSLSIPENSLHEIYSVRLSLRNGLKFGIEILCTGNVCRGPVLDTPFFELLLIATVEDRSTSQPNRERKAQVHRPWLRFASPLDPNDFLFAFLLPE